MVASASACIGVSNDLAAVGSGSILEAVTGGVQAPSANVGSGSGSILDSGAGALNDSTSMKCCDILVSVDVVSGSNLEAAPSGAQVIGGVEENALSDPVLGSDITDSVRASSSVLE